MAYISISLGLINLFPIPMLDGGHLMFYAFEKVLGRPLSQKVQEGFFRIGMFLLLSLMFFTTFNDLKTLVYLINLFLKSKKVSKINTYFNFTTRYCI
jgi:regulator of sigma E protease